MNIIFAAPAATGKTHFAEALRKHFKCESVYDEGRDGRWHAPNHAKNVLVLCTTMPSDVHGPVAVLDRDQMNRAMVAVGGIPIWNDDGSVNTLGKRKGLI